MCAAARPGPPPDLTSLTGSSVEAARSRLEQAGWRQIGVGDWAVALGDPHELWCARLVPFDPAYRMFAEDAMTGAPNHWLPHIADIVPLAPAGHLVLMERLWPADEDEAIAFCAALGIADDTDDDPPPTTDRVLEEDADLVDLRARIASLLAAGAARYPGLWGGSDIRAGNVMADASGALKLVDPVFIAGERIGRALRSGDDAALATLGHAELEGFVSIAYFQPHRDNGDAAVELRAALRRREPGRDTA